MYTYTLIVHTCIVLNILNAFVATSTCPHIFVVICVRDQAGPCGFVTFVEEGVDGETLQLLAKCGTIEQYKGLWPQNCKTTDATQEVASH